MSDLKITEKTIDVEDVFHKKNPRVAKMIPGFVFNFLRKLMHQDEANKLLYDNKDKFGLEFLNAALKDMNADIRVHGLENIPRKGKYILIANHPMGGFDGMALMQTVGKVRDDFYFLSNDLLMFLPNLRPLFVPINKHGSSQDYFNIINKTFEDDNIVLVFPAGLVSRKIDGKIQDLEWKNTFLSRAKRNKRDVIPVYVDGKNSNRFYNIAYWRKKLRVKANIEMFFLPDELFKQKNKPLNIYIGKPISYTVFDKSFKVKEWIAKVRNHVYNLKENIENPFKP